MANYFVTYDLNGPMPTHQEMDAHLRRLGKDRVHRVLETVWYVKCNHTLETLTQFVNRILSNNDTLLVIEARNAIPKNLLAPTAPIQRLWAA